MARRLILLLATLVIVAAAIYLRRHQPTPRIPNQCAHTDYGDGVTCIGGAGEGGNDAGVTSRTVAYSPVPHHAVIATAYTCADSGCQNIPATTLKLGDNLNDPETCFIPSPHSPFALNETSAGKQQLQEYIWMCPDIPAGVRSFTATCSVARACSFITLTLTEWTGLATTDVFDTDGGAASSMLQTTATIPTYSSTRYTGDLLYTFMDNTDDEIMTPEAPYRTALQFWSGNLNSAATAGSTGIQSATARWKGDDDWYGAIAAIRSAGGHPASHP